jgi:ribosomal-protein-alanine acetyltransferase
VNVRLATPADVPAIRALEKQADTAAHWGDEIYGGLFAAGAVKRMVLVADQNGSVSGFVVARAIADEWEIENIVVAVNLRLRGIASALIRNLVDHARARHVNQILLEVRQSNGSARALYANVGFVECGRRKSYYQGPVEDAISYRLELSPNNSKSAK